MQGNSLQNDIAPVAAGGQAACGQRTILTGHPNLSIVYDLNTRGLNGRLNPAQAKLMSMTKVDNLVPFLLLSELKLWLAKNFQKLYKNFTTSCWKWYWISI